MASSVLPEIEPIASAWQVIAAQAENLEPLERVTVSEAAVRHRIIDGAPWSFAPVPYLKRPCDCLDDPAYRLVAVQGPAQSAKSNIPNNWLLKLAIYAPSNLIWLQADKALMGDYVREKIEDMITTSQDLRARLMPDVGSDNVYRKAFRRGMIVNFIWPVGSQMRFRTAPNFVIDDYDEVPPDIGGQGDAITLLGARQTVFEGREKGFVGSSPALGPRAGIEGLVKTGTDERWTVECVHCRDPFVIHYSQLKFDNKGSPADAEASAALQCPVNGCVIEPRDKAKLIRSGDWVANRDGGDVASFTIDGLMGFPTWGLLAKVNRQAEITFETSQDEGPLRAFFNTRAGLNYRSKTDDLAPIDSKALADRSAAAGYQIGTVPDDVVCLTAAVDIGGNRFDVLVQGWIPGGRSRVIDRFAVLALEDQQTAIDPARRPEHWQVLVQKVIWRRYPSAGDPEVSLPILNTAIDTGGAEGVTDNAFNFWNACMGLGIPPTAITLIKGGNNPKAKLLPPPTIEVSRKAQKDGPDPELFVPNVHRFKNMIDVRLRREPGEAGHIDLPNGMLPEHVEEITAEEKINGVWVRPDGKRNETWDLLVYNAVALARLAGGDTSLAWVPGWARASRRGGERQEPVPQTVQAAGGETAPAAKPRRVYTRTTRMRLN